MIKDIMDDIISERKSKNIEDDYGIQNCWNKMIDILSKDINETVAYLENCSEEDIYFISEVFEDVSEQLQSKEYIECLRISIWQKSIFNHAVGGIVAVFLRWRCKAD